jgi:hypothetical protein
MITAMTSARRSPRHWLFGLLVLAGATGCAIEPYECLAGQGYCDGNTAMVCHQEGGLPRWQRVQCASCSATAGGYYYYAEQLCGAGSQSYSPSPDPKCAAQPNGYCRNNAAVRCTGGYSQISSAVPCGGDFCIEGVGDGPFCSFSPDADPRCAERPQGYCRDFGLVGCVAGYTDTRSVRYCTGNTSCAEGATTTFCAPNGTADGGGGAVVDGGAVIGTADGSPDAAACRRSASVANLDGGGCSARVAIVQCTLPSGQGCAGPSDDPTQAAPGCSSSGGYTCHNACAASE